MNCQFRGTKNYKYSIYFTENDQNNTELIEYNLLTRCRRVIFFLDNNIRIRNFYVSDSNVIVCCESDIYWTRRSDKLNNIVAKCNYVMNGDCLGFLNKKIMLDKYWDNYAFRDRYITSFNFLKVRNGEYVVDGKYRTFCHCDKMKDYYRGNNTIIENLIVSHDGQTIVYCGRLGLYRQNIGNISINELFKGKYGAKLIKCKNSNSLLHLDDIFWIEGGNCILIDEKIVYNLDNDKEMMVNCDSSVMYLVNCHILVICFEGCMDLYDVNIMQYVGKIGKEQLECLECSVFMEYNRELNVIILNNDCYRITECGGKYKLVHVILGVNYIADTDYVPNGVRLIMDLLVDTILDMLPNEILFVELYRCVLRVIEYF